MTTTDISRLQKLPQTSLKGSTQLHLRDGSRDYRALLSDLKEFVFDSPSTPLSWNGVVSSDTLPVPNAPFSEPSAYLVVVGDEIVPPTRVSVDLNNDELTISGDLLAGADYSVYALGISRDYSVYKETQTGVASQTEINLQDTVYDISSETIAVYVDNVRTFAFDKTDSTTITLHTPLTGGEALVIMSGELLVRTKEGVVLFGISYGFQTKAEMDAFLTAPTGSLAAVWGDTTPSNNTVYGWDGASWEVSEYNPLSYTDEEIVNLTNLFRESLLGFQVSLGVDGSLDYVASDHEVIVQREDGSPVIAIDAEGSIVGSLSEYAGNSVGVTSNNSINKTSLVQDEQGNVLMDVDNTDGSVTLIPSKALWEILGLKQSTSDDGVILQTEGGTPLVSVTDEGKLVASLSQNAQLLQGSGRSSAITSTSLAASSAEVGVVDVNEVTGELEAKLSPRCTDPTGASDPIISERVLVLTHGQSLGRGRTPSLSTTPSEFHLMFSGGTVGEDFDVNTGYSSLEPLVMTNNRENIGYSFSEYLNQQLPEQQFIYGNSCKGGAKLSEIDQGSSWYDMALSHITNAAALSNAEGKICPTSLLTYIQGEADERDDTSKSSWKSLFTTMVDGIKQHIDDVGGSPKDLTVLTYQTPSHTYYDNTAPTIAQAYYELMKEGVSSIATPLYFMDFEDGVHISSIYTKVMGCYFAKAYSEIERGRGWKPVSPRNIAYQNNIAVIHFNVPSPPLVIDTSVVTNPADFGFEVEDDLGAIPITTVSVGSDGKSVTLSFGRDIVEVDPIASPVRFRYAWTGVAGNDAGPTTGARGCLRDSCTQEAPFLVDGQPYLLRNYCIHFEETK